MWDFFWELSQQGDIAQARAEAIRSGDRARAAELRVAELEGRLEKLSLLCMAMWELVRDRTGLTQEELAAKVKALDEADGKADGRVTRVAKTCPVCGRIMSPKLGRCIYCGYEAEETNAFGKV